MRLRSVLCVVLWVGCFPRKPIEGNQSGPSDDSGGPVGDEADADTDTDTDADTDTDTGSSTAPDKDGDGYGTDEDCNDADSDINPGADEIWYDGVDSDCDGHSDYDRDGDGHDSDEYEGADCNDGNEAVHPGAAESSDDLDNDCDEYVDEDDVSLGDVIINEVMANPKSTDSGYEWLELANTSELYKEVHLAGWEINIETSTSLYEFYISPEADLRLQYNEPLVLCEDRSYFEAVSDVSCDYEYGTNDNGLEDSSHGPAVCDGATITNEYGVITVLLDGTQMDMIEYDSDDGWPLSSGHSFQLDPEKADHQDNDDPGSWCLAGDKDEWDSNGNLGTPGEGNRSCESSVSAVSGG